MVEAGPCGPVFMGQTAILDTPMEYYPEQKESGIRIKVPALLNFGGEN